MSREQAIASASKPTATEVDTDVLVQELEEELRRAVSVCPSPDFARKVRARIDEGRRGRDWRPWRLAAAAACLVALAVGLLVAAREHAANPTQPAGIRTGVDVRLAAEPAPASEPDRQTAAGRVPVDQASRTRRPSQPEVIVPEGNARALTKLLALARSGRIDEAKLTPVLPTALPATLDVPPLVVPAIAVPEIESLSVASSDDDGRRQ